MSDGALDLSISSYEVSGQHHPPRTHDPVSSDSGRASSDSTSSDIHEDLKPGYKTSPPPPPLPPPPPPPPSSRTLPSPPSGAFPPPPPSSSSISGAGILSHQVPSSNSNNNNNNINNTHHLAHSPHSPKSPVTFPPSSSRLRNPLPPTQSHQQQHQPTAPSPQHPHTTSFASSSSISGIGNNATLPRAGDSGRHSNSNSPVATPASSSLQEEDMKSFSLSSSLSDRGVSDPRIAPIRPFKMYPVDAFNVYNSQLLPGTGSGLSPSSVGIQSLYDSAASPSNFPSFPLTPLTSHLLQRKRRAELRDNANNNPSPGSVKSESGSPVTMVDSSSPIFGSTGVSTTLSLGEPMAKRSGSSSSSEGQENETDAEKRAKMVSDEKKDDAYWDRRRKNNEAAKRSRDARRQKEEEIAMRAAYLEQENLKLRAQVAILKNETAKLHYMLYNRI